jgi:hypothetical protein
MGLSHWPDVVQVWTALPEHSDAPGVHTPPVSAETSVAVSSGASEEDESTVES